MQVVLQPDTVYERIQFQFEDEAYDTVSDLITYYVGSGKVISALSGARIQTPKNRLHPLSFYASKYSLQRQGLSGTPITSPLYTVGNPRYNGVSASVNAFPSRNVRDTAPRLPDKQRSLSLTPAEAGTKVQMLQRGNEKSNSADGVIKDPKASSGKYTTHSLTREAEKEFVCGSGNGLMGRNTKISRVTSDPALSPCFERRGNTGEVEGSDPPPKPSRLPSLALPQTEISASYRASGSDSGNGSGDSVQSSATGDSNEASTPCAAGGVLRGVVIKNPRYGYDSSNIPSSASSTTLKAIECDPSTEDFLLNFLPENTLNSVFDLENFQTLLLPTLENKPVDSCALQCVKNMLHENGSRVLANHLTKIDFDITVNKKKVDENWNDLGLGVSSGIEMCALPQGHQIRKDIIERRVLTSAFVNKHTRYTVYKFVLILNRVECLKLLVAVTILTCTNESERAEALNKWIQVAIDIKTALGNLFGFCAIMLGLCLPQVCLNSTYLF